MTLTHLSRAIPKGWGGGLSVWLVVSLLGTAVSDAQQLKAKAAAGVPGQAPAKTTASASEQKPVQPAVGTLQQEPVKARPDASQPEPAKTQQALVLSERDAVKKAVGNSRQLAAFRTGVRALEGRALCSSCNLRNPELRLADISTKYFYADPTVNKQFQVGLRWRPPRLGEMGANQQREVVGLWEKKVDEDKYRRELVAEVRKTYAELAFYGQSRELAVQQAGLEERRNTAVQRLVGLGQKAILDQIKGRRRLIKAREEATKLTRRYENTKNKLRALTGEKREITAVFGDPHEKVPEFPKLRAQAIKIHPDLALTEERAKLSDLRYQETHYAQFPWFSFVEADYHHESVNLDWGELRVGIDIPVFRWGSAALDSTAIAKDARSEYEAATVESIDRTVADALSAYQEAFAEWQSLKAEAESFVPGTEGLIGQARQQGSIPISDVIDLELATVELRQMVLEARFALAEASIELCEAVGVDSWEELGK